MAPRAPLTPAAVVVRSAILYLALCVVEGAALALADARLSFVAVQGAGVAFAATLVVAEIVAAGVMVATQGRAATSGGLAAGLSLAAAAVTTALLALLVERVFPEATPWGVGFGGILAAAQTALARIGDARAPEVDGVVRAALTRLVDPLRRALLAVAGVCAPQDTSELPERAPRGNAGRGQA